MKPSICSLIVILLTSITEHPPALLPAGERQNIAQLLWTLALVVGQDARQRGAAAPVHVLTNKSVVSGGTSLQHFVHPRLPIALLGYRRAGRGAGAEPG